MNRNAKKAPPPPAGLRCALEALYARRVALDQLIQALERYERMAAAGNRTVLTFPDKLAC
jgi:hypothetical protein